MVSLSFSTPMLHLGVPLSLLSRLFFGRLAARLLRKTSMLAGIFLILFFFLKRVENERSMTRERKRELEAALAVTARLPSNETAETETILENRW